MTLTQKQVEACGNITCVVDIGASDGRFSKEIYPAFPQARYVCVEPQVYPDRWSPAFVRWIDAVAGKKNGKAFLNVGEDKFGAGLYGRDGGIEVDQVRLDDVITEEGPLLIKMDCHGSEIPIFLGGPKTFAKASALIIEQYAHKISKTCVTFDKMFPYMEMLGFRLAGIMDTMVRPKDGVLWQLDALYLRSENPVFNSNEYQ